jgi:hypothetical protein
MPQREPAFSKPFRTVVDRSRSPVSAVVLVEGLSDQAALEVLARRRGRDLEVEASR